MPPSETSAASLFISVHLGSSVFIRGCSQAQQIATHHNPIARTGYGKQKRNLLTGRRPAVRRLVPTTKPAPKTLIAMTRSQIAARLGRMARGVPKKFSPEEIARRTARLLKAAKAHRARIAKAKKTKKARR